MGGELGVQLGVGRLNAGAELVGREDGQVELHLLVALAVFLVDLGVR